ncbi:CsbD family protein [Bradyrhizobium sp. WSM 1704]|uniref:CsbD family protein n=1 Tax=Bradyrhizobium semiaridum TaxID=2821404 RepID=UPI001CE2861A|nr:CsbD family protein [Bradyrhizobium semiaridum]MCA6125963.1 CsbD family protein [Bradyrhizobium semiaridum]
MGSTTDRIKGTANDAIGKLKRRFGEATGSPAMQGRGATQQAKGKGQKALGGVKRIVRNAVNRAIGGSDWKF